MTSPSSMLVPDHCVNKGQHSTFDDSWTSSYLCAWEKFCRHCYQFNNLIHMCAYSAILRLKIINNKSIEAIKLSKIPRDIWGRWHWVRYYPHRFQTGWCCATVTNQSILPRILGISDIYRWTVGPLWIHTYIFFLGRGQEITGETLFFSHFFISYSQHCLKICVSCC